MSRDVTGSNIGLSFIDVLASALGAAVLLFVILASAPPGIASGAQASGTFLRYEWTIQGNPNALLRLVVKSPGDPNPYVVDLPDIVGATVRKCGLRGVSSILVAGFAAGAYEGGQAGERHYILRLNQPVSGSWLVGILYYDRVDEMSSTVPGPVSIRTNISHDSKVKVTESSNVQEKNRCGGE